MNRIEDMENKSEKADVRTNLMRFIELILSQRVAAARPSSLSRATGSRSFAVSSFSRKSIGNNLPFNFGSTNDIAFGRSRQNTG